MNTAHLGQPGATSFARLPHGKAKQISRLSLVGADGATCFNPYVWACGFLILLCRNIEMVRRGCPIRPKPPQTRVMVDDCLGQPRISSCPRLPQVAPSVCHS